MWAAANDGVRRRRRRDKRRRTGGAAGSNEDDPVNGAKKKSSGSDSDSEDDSSDGERSTTESVHDNGGPSSSSSGNNLSLSPPGDRSSRVENCAPHAGAGDDTAAAATAFGQQTETRKRKRRKKKKKQQIREETPEAAIARLKSSYTAAMAAIGALHRLSRQYCAFRKEEGNAGGVVRDAGAAKANGAPPSNIGDVDACRTIDATCAIDGDDEETTLETSQRENEADAADENLREAYTSMQRVARAARSALEQSLLMDHVIMAPIFLPEKGNASDKTKKGNIKNNARYEDDASGVVMSSAWLDLWNHPPKETPEAHISLNARSIDSAFQTTSITKWNKLSSSHRNEIRKVSYLALVNYADLLLCVCHASATNRKRDMLDRGAVPKLGLVELFSTINGTNRLWSDESTERTVRLALAAYVDASELDPTDPTLWFKLACAARALGWEIQSSSSKALRIFKGPPRSHRCLERLALERGLLCLPKEVPPNRLVLHAWKEMENWDRGPPVCVEKESDLDTLVSVETLDEMLTQEDQPVELVIHLPRYSWAALGRILIRASQEGVSYGRSLPGTPRHVWSTVSNS